MNDTALHYQTLATLAPRIQSGELSPVALTEALLSRIQTLNPALNVFRLLCAERALAVAQAAESQIKAGQYLGPLHGIPYVTKDLFDVAGLPTTAGSNTLANNIATQDATVTRKLAQAGMVLLGKTNTVEFAFGSVGVNHNHGTPHNPWHRDHHVPGGSSSGTAVAVATGLAPVGTGSDTACSVRTPAALCGIVGLKTTVGRISRGGVFPLSHTLDSIGPLTRSVYDAALLCNVLQGADEADPATLQQTPIDTLSNLKGGVQGLRIAVAEQPFFADLDSDTERAVRNAIQVFRDLGAQVNAIDYPEAEQSLAIPMSLSQVEGAAHNRDRLDSDLEQMDPMVGPRMILGRKISAPDYAVALLQVQQLRQSQRETLRNVDIILAPTCQIPACALTEATQSFDAYMHYAKAYMRNCLVGNLLDLCAVSVPCGLTAQGLPVGLMVYAKPWCEDLALRAAYAFEQATDFSQQHPALDWL
jgi:aspartyl-tRNA(Asn)/glutamyl-tRNA(Gln) amidotransferase subunit A